MKEHEIDTVTRECQETELNLCLAAAQLNRGRGDYPQSEKLYRRAIRWGVQRWGPKNANVGLILLELQDLYDLQKMTLESESVEDDVRVILRHYFYKFLRHRDCRLRNKPFFDDHPFG